jgi:Domain of Unknown Function (DUF1206)
MLTGETAAKGLVRSMNRSNSFAGKAKDQTDEALEWVAASPWTERLARFGYASKGVVYIVIGALATMAALGIGGDTADPRGALQTIAMQPFGKILLGVVGFGLIAYVIWRWVQAAADVDSKGTDFKGLSVRVGYGLSGLVYAGLAWTAIQIVFDYGGSDNGDAPQDWTARLMSLPYGRWLAGLTGAGIIVFGLYQIYKGYRAKFRKRLKLREMRGSRAGWATLSGRIGYAARGVVLCIVGAFVVQAALRFDATEVRGLDGALRTLARQSFGPWILGVVAAGLVAYGLYMLVEARYRSIADS